MSIKENLFEFSQGDSLRRFWRLYYKRSKTASSAYRSLLTLLMCRSASRHGGYIGPGAVIEKEPNMPHGLRGVFISRFASIGEGATIYQNVTIGEVNHKAPVIGKNCLIGAGAVLIGDIRIGDNVRIGAGAVVSCDISDNCTAVSEPVRIIWRRVEES